MARQTSTPPPDDLLSELEKRLAGTLKPIRPTQDVVQRLRERIRMPAREEITLRLLDWKRMFLVFGGGDIGYVSCEYCSQGFFLPGG